MKKFTLSKATVILLLCSFSLHAQVGIGNTSPKSTLDIAASSTSSPTNKDGILIPRVDAFPELNPDAEQNGMMVFLNTAVGTNDVGFYYWNNPDTRWVGIGAEEWKAGTNESGDNLIYATRAKLTGTDMVITDDGRIGFGTSDPVERFEFRGTGVASKITGATITKGTAGVYNVAFTAPRSSANYIIQLRVKRCASCGATDDSFTAYYTNQTTTGFTVNTGYNDNGTTALGLTNTEFMFTVIDF